MEAYGEDHEGLRNYMRSFGDSSISVELIEVFKNTKGTPTVVNEPYSDCKLLKKYLCKKAPKHQTIRVLSIARMSGPLMRLLGSKYEMDYELWTAHFQLSDREWFACPLVDQGARRFSYFNLSCVDFRKTTPKTPQAYQFNQKLSHTMRLMRLLDVRSSHSRQINPHQLSLGSRVYVVRQISGYIRRDKGLWTFIYMCYSYTDISDAHLDTEIPGNTQPHLSSWITEFLNVNSPDELVADLQEDGFGFVQRVLREIKSTWKLLLNDMEAFLEDMNEDYNDEELINAATWLHRQFISNLDYCQRQLLYHQRYITYLTDAPIQEGLFLAPGIFTKDLTQESDALHIMNKRLVNLRSRTTDMLDTVLSLSTVKQARFAREIATLQREDAITTFNQGESVRRLTILNMVYLPATFIATIFGMNVAENAESHWRLWTFALSSILLTACTLCLAFFKIASTAKDQTVMQLTTGQTQTKDSLSTDAGVINPMAGEDEESLANTFRQWVAKLGAVRVVSQSSSNLHTRRPR
ncbi:hypothetical protein WHR41_05974 [Cladosporium halotolerans]|uniref:Uncharacterized protein n=1 Tax=Cladosporium halotolerans TaxID=1052096 RepID=A0AB34KQZ9_9PEZI